MRRTPGIVVVAPWVFARTNRFKTKMAFGIGDKRTTAGEIRIQWGIVLVACVQVTACRVSLPNLDQGAGDGPAILILYPPADQDSFPQGRPVCTLGQVDRLDAFRGSECGTG